MLATRSLGCVFLGSGERVALSKAPLQILLPSPRGNYGYRRHQEMTLRKIYASWDNASHSFRVELETEALAWQRQRGSRGGIQGRGAPLGRRDGEE